MNGAGGVEISVQIVPNGRVTIVHLMIVNTASLSKTMLKNTENQKIPKNKKRVYSGVPKW